MLLSSLEILLLLEKQLLFVLFLFFSGQSNDKFLGPKYFKIENFSWRIGKSDGKTVAYLALDCVLPDGENAFVGIQRE